jgi:hypothetical protein
LTRESTEVGGEFVEEEKVGTDMVWVRSFELTEAKCLLGEFAMEL